MKVLNNQLLLVVLLFVSVLGYVESCTHKDVVVPAPASTSVPITRGTHVHKPGLMTKGDTTMWKLDKVHSNAMWSTNYMGAAGLLTGRFNMFGVHDVTTAKMITYTYSTATTSAAQPLLDTSWYFDESHPENTYFNGYVQINTSNTGEPGRDTGCNITTLGTVKFINGIHNLTEVNLAKIKTTKVEFDPISADYIVYFNLTWKGNNGIALVKPLVGKLKYISQGVVGAGTSTAYGVFGLQFQFQFNCRDFGIASTSISDKIDIQCNMNFNNK
jgi:polyisoprenoid-binding protein YceI